MNTARLDETALQIARQTRARFVAAVDPAFEAVARAVHERLLHQAAQTATAREMQERRDHLMAFEASQSTWVSQARTHWHQALTEGVSAGTASAPARLELELELVGDDTVENGILSSRLALAIHDTAGSELNDLRHRMQHLLQAEELDARDLLRPEVLARVAVDQWVAAGLSRPLWIAVRELLHARLAEGAAQAYKEANAFLIAQGVLPTIDIKRMVRRPASAGGATGTGGATSGLGGMAGVQSAPMASVPAAADWQGAGGSVAAVPRGAATGFVPATAGMSSASLRAGPAGPGMGMAVPPGFSPFVQARNRAQGMLVSLRRLIGGGGGNSNEFAAGADDGMPMVRASAVGGAGPAGTGRGAPAGPAPAFVTAIAEAASAFQMADAHDGAGSYVLVNPVEGAAAVRRSAAELRRHSNQLKQKAPTTADKATVEIVALMFQAILAEERIPFSARVWFARLQMPVLRVAIAEAEFFGTLQHPARMLIDRMGSVVMGFDAASISGSAMENEIRRVVQVIEQYPETGQRVFKLVYDEFVAFLSKHLTQNDSTQRAMSVAQQVEQKETMAIQYTIELRKMLNDMPVREEIREFLFKIWAEVLAMAAIKYGGQGEQTVSFKRTASELVWAASAKPSRTDRARVIQELPKLLQRLRQGMELLGLTGAPQEEHIKTIGRTLSDAFMSKTAAISTEQIQAMAARLSNLEDYVGEGEEGEELPLDVGSIELLLGVDAASIEVLPNSAGAPVSEDVLQWAQELQVGNWFMLDHNGRVSQVQFVWRSERKRLYLFAAADGNKFMIQVGRLASYLQSGLLVPAEEESLTARATREALAKLDANPERLLN